MHEAIIKEFLSKQTANWQNTEYSDGKYFGEIKQGKRDGDGIMYFNNKTIQFGLWKNDIFRFGTEIHPNGDLYNGYYWDADNFDGVCETQNGDRISGHWIKGELSGYCAHYYGNDNPNGLYRFSGYFENGLPNGIGTMMTNDGLYYGIFKDGEQIASYDQIDNSNEAVVLRLTDIILSLLGVEKEEITNKAKLMEDLDADNLDMVNILTAVEGQFGLVVNDDDYEKVVTFGDLVDLVWNNLPKD